MDANQAFASIMLRASREEARKHKVKLPKLTTWLDTASGGNPWREVWGDADIVWQGVAHSASEAKANAIDKLVAAALRDRGLDPEAVMYADGKPEEE